MPHKRLARQFRSGLEEVKEGLPLARRRLRTLASRRSSSTEQKDLEIIREIQRKRRRRFKSRVGEEDIKFRERNIRKQLEALERRRDNDQNTE